MDAPDPDALGVAAPGAATFGPDVWAGADAELVTALLRRVPADLTSPSLRALARRLLLTNAAPAPAPGQAPAEGGLLTLRIQRLHELGELDAVRALLDVMPQRLENETIARVRAEAAWLEEDREAACRGVRNGVAGNPQSDYWAQALIACQISFGEADQAALGIELLREQGAPEAAGFIALATRALGLETELPDAAALLDAGSPFAVTLLGVAGVELPAGWQRQAPPTALRAVLATPVFPLAERTRAAERLVAMAALDPDRLAALYQAFEAAARNLAAAVELVGTSGGVESRAALYQAVQEQDLSAARAELLQLALTEVWDGALYAAGVRVLTPVLTGLRPAPELAWFAATAGRALHAIGRLEGALAWGNLAREQAALDPEAAAAAQALWPYARLSGVEDPTMSLDDWAAARAAERPEAAVDEDRFALTLLLVALGVEGRPTWTELAAAGDQTPARVAAVAPLFAIAESAGAGRTGLTLLLVLGELGGRDLAGLDPLVLGNGLSGLSWLGLTTEARALAIEVALARDL